MHLYRILNYLILSLIGILPFSADAQVNSPLNDFSPPTVNSSASPNDSLLFIKEGRNLVNTLSIYPNPIQEKVNISYFVKKENLVSIRILDVLGNEVLSLMSEKKPNGFHQNTFQLSGKVPRGFYFIRISVGGEIAMRRISIQ